MLMYAVPNRQRGDKWLGFREGLRKALPLKQILLVKSTSSVKIGVSTQPGRVVHAVLLGRNQLGGWRKHQKAS